MNNPACSHGSPLSNNELTANKFDSHSHCVSSVPIFNHLQPEELVFIANKAVTRTYERGEFIHRSGDFTEQLYIVQQGKVKVYRLSEGGREQLVRILLPGDFAGEMALFTALENDSYAEAMEDSRICTIQHKDVNELLQRYPAISLHMLAELAKRLDNSEKQTAIIAGESVNARIGKYLLALAQQAGKESFELPMSRKHLASYLGTSPETISRRLGEFEEAGWIRQTGLRTITLLNGKVLSNL